MNMSLRLASLAGVAVLAGLLATGCAEHGPAMRGSMMQGGGMMAGSGSQQMHMQTMAGMHEMEGMRLTGDTDKDFVRMMRMHHLQGIAMARTELQKGTDAQAKQFAQKIIDSQSKEVEQFDDWLQRHR